MKYVIAAFLLLSLAGCSTVEDDMGVEATFPVVERWWK